MSKKPTVLMILDGYGLNDNKIGNAVAEADTPVMDALMKEYPFVKGNASGHFVGLPDGQMGNSEVGHLNMGAGRIVYQDLTKITKAIKDGDFFENPELVKACENVKAHDSALHLFGLVSDGGVHSHNSHLYGLLELAKRQEIFKVYVHCFLDGRDTPPMSGKEYVKELKDKMDEIGVGQIATVIGRYYVMDRDNRWERVEKAYDAIVNGIGNHAENPLEAIEASYQQKVTDEFVVPTVIAKNGHPVEVYAKRLQIQEKMTVEIADALMECLAPKGVMVLLEAEHMCMTMRGIKKPGSKTVSVAVRGVFEENERLQNMFFRMIQE